MNFLQWMETFRSMFVPVKQRAIEFLPNFLGSLAIFLVGLLVAYLLHALAYRFLKNLGRWIPHKRVQEKIQPTTLDGSARIIAKIIYWVVLFLFLTAATEALGMPVVTTWLSGIASYLPRIIAAVLIVAIGLIGGILLRDVIISSAASARIAHGNVLGKLAQYAIVLISLLIGIQEVGIDISFLTNLIIILVSAALFGAALAFGLGARGAISNILACYYLQKTYKIGQCVNIGGREGRIIRITPEAVILENSEGFVYVPARHFEESPSLLLKGKEG